MLIGNDGYRRIVKMNGKKGYVAIRNDGSPFAYYADTIEMLVYTLATEEEPLDEYCIFEVGGAVRITASRVEDEE